MSEHRCMMGYLIEDARNADEDFYVLAFPELTIYGHTVDHYTRQRYPEDFQSTVEGRKEGIEFGCWHSVACPEGEVGSQGVDGLRRIGRDEFLEAWDAGWPEQPPALNAPIMAVGHIEEDGTIVRTWDSLHGDYLVPDKDHEETPEWMKDGAHAVRDAMLELIQRHEADAHGGGPCYEQRIGMIAFLGHSVGMTPGEPFGIMLFAHALGVYELRHHEGSEHGGD